jgi:hypothetical protein
VNKVDEGIIVNRLLRFNYKNKVSPSSIRIFPRGTKQGKAIEPFVVLILCSQFDFAQEFVWTTLILKPKLTVSSVNLVLS